MSDQQRLLSEVQWLADNPHFAERPATIREFVGADYLGLQDTIRPGVMAALVEIFGEDVDPQWISVRRKAISTGAIGIGKCSTLDAMVNLSDGTYKRAGDIRPGDRTPGGTVVASQSNGIKPVYTVTTTWGQELELTGNHPVWVEGREWVHVEDLQPGDELRVHRGWEAENPDDHDADLYRLAGYLIADGGLTTPTPTWGKGNVALEQDMHEICQRRGWSMREMSPGRSDNYRQYRIRSDGDLRRLLVDLGMYGKGAAEKSVPDFVFRSSNAMIEQFLCAYLESDGRTDEHGAEFYSVSRDLLWGVQKLLLRLGVVSKLQVKNGRYKGEVHKSWRLRVPAAGWNVISRWDFRDEANRVQTFDYVDPDTVPLGLCGCGCGEETAVPVKNNRSKGEVKGVPKRFRRGHSNRHRPEITNPTCRVESVTFKGEEETWAIQVEPTNHLYIEDVLTHNTTIASIILTYCVHWCYCLRDPQKFFGLMPGSRIAFMLMSTSESQAKEVLFGDIKARIESSRWFQRFCDYDRNFKNQLRMAKNLWIVPGGSEESRFEGYNVLVGIIDEGDSHKKTQRKDYAEEGYDTISSRIASRFTDPVANKYKGLLVVIGQMKSKTGFMSRIYSDFVEDPDAAAIRMTFWESIGWNHYTEEPGDATSGRETAPRKSFVYDIQHKRIISRDDADADGIDYRTKDSGFLEVPTAFLTQFKRNPVKALRDLAGIPPEATDPFIALPHRITSCQDAWHQRMGEGQPVSSSATYPALSSSFRPLNQIKRIAHVDIAYCVDDQTEILTQRGWLRYDEVREGDLTLGLDEETHLAEWTPVSRVNVHPSPGEMYSIEGKGHSSLTTANHRWYVRERKYDPQIQHYRGFKPAVVLSEDLSERYQIIAGAPMVNLPTEATYSDAFVELVAWYWTEGNVMKNRDGSWSRYFNVTQSWRVNEANCDRIRGVFVDLFGPPVDKFDRLGRTKPTCTQWREWRRDNGNIVWYGNSVIGEMLHQVAPEKIVSPEFIYSLTRAQLELFVSVSQVADGHGAHAPGEMSQRDPRALDGLQMAQVLLGRRTTRSVHKSGMHYLSAAQKRTTVTASRKNIEVVPHEGIVWCPTTPKGSWLARRNGSTYFTGNSGNNGDAMGIAMAHIPGIISVDGEDQPLIVFDFVMRIKAKPGSQIELAEMRRILRRVRDDYGFNLKMVTFDGFASVDSMQALRKSGFQVDYVSVDRNKQPYEDLREGIYDERILFPKYMTHLNEDDSETVNIIYQELSQLTDTGPKIDHPPAGSKDCADAMAACVSTLMQMPQWRRGVPMLESRASDAPRAGDVDSEDLAPVGQMLTNAGKSRRAPGAVPTFGEFTARGLGESSPGVQAVKERSAAPFVGRQRDVSMDPFLR